MSDFLKRWGVFFVYFGILSFFLWPLKFDLVWLWVGAVMGVLILALDHVAYVVAYPHELTSQRVIQLARSRQWRQAYILLKSTTEERIKLFFHQALGQIVLLILGVYLLTSSGSLFGKGLILSANLDLLVEVWEGFLDDPNKLKNWLFQQVRGGVSEEALRGYVFTVTLGFLILSFLGAHM